MEIPEDVSKKIFEIDVSRDAKRISDTVRKKMVPHKHGALSNPFFCCGEQLETVPFKKIRSVCKPLPKALIPLYESYPDDTEFRIEDIVFMSETEAIETNGWIDFAIIYLGMGHVNVFAYHSERDVVVSGLDGGANGFDRIENNTRRNECLKRVGEGLPLRASNNENFPNRLYLTFHTFWEEVVEGGGSRNL